MVSKNFELGSLANQLNVDQSTGEVTAINMDSDVITEGTSNLYFTDTRVDTRVSNLVVGGSNITTTYDAVNGTLTIDGQSGYSDSDVNTFLAGGTAGNIVTTGYLAGPAEFVIDPAGIGDNTGKVVIAGDLQVDGTTTTVNSTTLAISDKEIVVAKDAASAAGANGAGIKVAFVNATMLYNAITDRWVFNKDIEADVFSIANHNLDSLGDVNLSVAPVDGQALIWDNANSEWIAGDSFSQSDFDAAIALTSVGDLQDVDITTVVPGSGEALVWNGSKFAPGTTFSQNDFNTAFAAKTTNDLTEGSNNLYYTNARVDQHLSSGLVGNIVVGDISAQDVNVAGDLNVSGTTTTVNQTTLTVSDSKIFLADGNIADFIDIGTIYNYNDGSNRTAGIFRDASDGKFNFYTNYLPAVGTTLDKAHPSFTGGTIVAYEFEGRVDWDNIYNKDDVIFNSIEVGDITITGTQTVNNTTTVSTVNPLILLNNNPSLNVDTGFIGQYEQSGIDRASGLFRDASDGKFKFFTNSTQSFSDSSTVDPSATGYTLAQVEADEFLGDIQWSFVKNAPAFATALGDLSDVDINTTPPSNGQALVYDATNAEWVPGAGGGGGGSALFGYLNL
jgi:hypothetical protein